MCTKLQRLNILKLAGPPAHFHSLEWLQLLQTRPFDDDLLSFGVFKTQTIPFSKAALCPMAADKCCMDIIGNNQVEVKLAYCLQIDYDISVSLKAQSISTMYINLMPKTLYCERAYTSIQDCDLNVLLNCLYQSIFINFIIVPGAFVLIC